MQRGDYGIEYLGVGRLCTTGIDLGLVVPVDQNCRSGGWTVYTGRATFILWAAGSVRHCAAASAIDSAGAQDIVGVSVSSRVQHCSATSARSEVTMQRESEHRLPSQSASSSGMPGLRGAGSLAPPATS